MPAVIRGLAPLPDFLIRIGLDELAVEVVISPAVGVKNVSVYPAATLKITPPGPTPELFSAVIADARAG